MQYSRDLKRVFSSSSSAVHFLIGWLIFSRCDDMRDGMKFNVIGNVEFSQFASQEGAWCWLYKRNQNKFHYISVHVNEIKMN